MANLVSLLRTLLCFVVVVLLFFPSYTMYWACFGLTALVIWMDGLDGYLARKFQESSKAGALIDILGDRIVEQVYWVAFLALGWVPLWIPLVVIVRGILVDGLRSVAFEQGYTAFGEASMMKSPLGALLVSSRLSRWSYAVLKGFAFGFMILGHTPDLSPEWTHILLSVAWTSVYGSVFFCVARGLPVLVEGRRFLVG